MKFKSSTASTSSEVERRWMSRAENISGNLSSAECRLAIRSSVSRPHGIIKNESVNDGCRTFELGSIKTCVRIECNCLLTAREICWDEWFFRYKRWQIRNHLHPPNKTMTRLEVVLDVSRNPSIVQFRVARIYKDLWNTSIQPLYQRNSLKPSPGINGNCRPI